MPGVSIIWLWSPTFAIAGRWPRVVGEHRPQTLYHLFAESPVDRSIDTPLGFVKTNVLGTATLLDAALGYWRRLDAAGRGTFRFVHVSTDEVYGELRRAGTSTTRAATVPICRTRQARPASAVSRGSGTGPSGSRWSSRTARIITAPSSLSDLAENSKLLKYNFCMKSIPAISIRHMLYLRKKVTSKA
jgi:hypothetical protein